MTLFLSHRGPSQGPCEFSLSEFYLQLGDVQCGSVLGTVGTVEPKEPWPLVAGPHGHPEA